jgi:hypothetical protein
LGALFRTRVNLRMNAHRHKTEKSDEFLAVDLR